MVLNIVALLLVLGLVFVHSMFGLFSGVLNTLACVVGLAAAFGFFEPLTDFLTRQFDLPPAYMAPVCLVGLYVFTTLLLRVGLDSLIRGNVKVPDLANWIGGAVCGLIIGQISVGVLVIGVLMLPLGDRPLLFDRLARVEGESDPLHPDLPAIREGRLWLRSDRFAAGLAGWLSRGSLRGPAALHEVYPDFVQWVNWTGNVVQVESSPAVARDRTQDGYRGLRVSAWWTETGPLEVRYRREVPTAQRRAPPYERRTFAPADGHVLLGARLELEPSVADRAGGVRRHVFRPTQIRVVGTLGRRPAHFAPRVLANADPRLEGQPRLADPDSNFSLPGNAPLHIYAFFEVPEDFTPRFVEYRRFARAPLGNRLEARPELEITLGGGAEAAEAGAPAVAAGPTRFADQTLPGTGVSAELPGEFTVSEVQRSGDVEVRGQELASGRFAGPWSRLTGGSGATIRQFRVPSGYRLVQIRFRPRRAASLIGRVFNFVARTANQYRLVDDTDQTWPLCGYYAIVEQGGERFIEVYYTGRPDAPEFRGVLDFKHIEPRLLTEQDDAEVGLLFLVRPGRTILRLENQRGDGLELDLRVGP